MNIAIIIATLIATLASLLGASYAVYRRTIVPRHRMHPFSRTVAGYSFNGGRGKEGIIPLLRV